MSEQRSAKHWEDRPGWASCFPPRNPRTEHPPDFTGITVLDGRKFWVNVYKKLDRNGNRYVSVKIRATDAPACSRSAQRTAPAKDGGRV
jgi:hypothetical protein